MNSQPEQLDDQTDQESLSSETEDQQDSLEQAKAELLEKIKARPYEVEGGGTSNNRLTVIVDQYVPAYYDFKTQLQDTDDQKSFREQLTKWKKEEDKKYRTQSSSTSNAHQAMISIITNALQAESHKVDIEITENREELIAAIKVREKTGAEINDPKNQMPDILNLVQNKYAAKYRQLKKQLEGINDFDQARKVLDKWKNDESKWADINYAVIQEKGVDRTQSNNAKTIISIIVQVMQERYLNPLLAKETGE